MHWPSDTSYLIFKLAGMKVMAIIFNIVKGKKSDQQIMCGGGLSGHPSRWKIIDDISGGFLSLK